MGKHKKKKRDISDSHSELIDRDTNLKDEDFSTNTTEKDLENEAVTSKKYKKKKDKKTHERFNYDSESNPTKMGKESKLEKESTIAIQSTPLGQHEHGLLNSEDGDSNLKEGKKKKSKKKKKERDHTTTYNNINEDNSFHTVSSKKRKRSEKSENSGHINDSVFDHCESVVHVKKMEEETGAEDGKFDKKKHKKKKSRREKENSQDTTVVEDIPEVKPVKKKKRKKDEEHNTSPKISTDHFNSKHETTVHASGKIISTDFLNSNEKVSNTVGKPVAGQWDTNAFDDEAKQNKFLRLLGGFKNGADKASIQQKLFEKNSFTNNLSKSSFGSPKYAGNMAMTKDQQETYKKTMESEYESAMSMHLNRGTGLGFQSPQPAKKFSIDTQTSKSIKFDDSD